MSKAGLDFPAPLFLFPGFVPPVDSKIFSRINLLQNRQIFSKIKVTIHDLLL